MAKKIKVITRYCTQSTCEKTYSGMCCIIAWDWQEQLTVLMRIYYVITNATGGNVWATLPESLICLLTCIILCAYVSLWPDWELMQWSGWLVLYFQGLEMTANGVQRWSDELNSLLERLASHYALCLTGMACSSTEPPQRGAVTITQTINMIRPWRDRSSNFFLDKEHSDRLHRQQVSDGSVCLYVSQLSSWLFGDCGSVYNYNYLSVSMFLQLGVYLCNWQSTFSTVTTANSGDCLVAGLSVENSQW